MSYTPPNGNEVAINFKDLYTPPAGNEVAIEFNPSDEPICIPDWYLPSGNSLFVDYELCNDDGVSCDNSWVNQPGSNVQLNFGDCDPLWISQSGNSVQISFDSSSTSSGDWVETIGDQANIDFNCCDDTPVEETILITGRSTLSVVIESEIIHTTRYSISGDVLVPQIVVNGEVHLVTDVYNVWGDYQFEQINCSGDVVRGNDVNGSTGISLSEIECYGEAYTIPDGAFTVSGEIQLNQISVLSSVEHLLARVVDGNLKLDIISTGRIDIPYDVDGVYSIQQIAVIGDVRTHITEVEGNCLFDEIECSGDIVFTDVPTFIDANIQLDQIKSEQIGGEPIGNGNHVYWSNFRYEIGVSGYIATPFEVNGSATFDGITANGTVIVDGIRPDYDGVLVYATFNRLFIEIESDIIHPIHVDGDCSFDPIQITSDVLASAVVTSSASFRNIVCFGLVDNGIDTLQNVIMQLYEISNNQSMDIIEYPKTAKFPVYIPTTLYNIQNVELRRGTVEYTVEYVHERDIISRIILWVMDENGVATKDTYVTFNNEQEVPYELHNPYKFYFNVNIPLHCVTDKKNKFFLEIIYDNILDDKKLTVIDRPSRVVEFQAHVDNKDVFVNSTDRLYTDNSNTSNNYFEVKSELPTSIYYNVDDDFCYENTSSMNASKLSFETFVLSSINLEGLETTFNYTQESGHIFYNATFYNLDTGQIGG